MTYRQASVSFVLLILAVGTIAFWGCYSNRSNVLPKTIANAKGWQIHPGRLAFADPSHQAYALGDTVVSIVDGRGNFSAQRVEGLNQGAVSITMFKFVKVGGELFMHDRADYPNFSVGFSLEITVDSLTNSLAFFTMSTSADTTWNN